MGRQNTPAASSRELDEAFRVARWMDVFGGFISRHKRLGIKDGNL
jgi:hypothetical protein